MENPIGWLTFLRSTHPKTPKISFLGPISSDSHPLPPHLPITHAPFNSAAPRKQISFRQKRLLTT